MAHTHNTFERIDNCYREQVKTIPKEKPTYMIFSKKENLLKDVKWMHRQFEILMRTLIKYLEAKRVYFPRLYFLSNEQIIEIVGTMEDI